MKHPQKRTIHFHGVFKEKYQSAPLEVYADSMFNLFNTVFKCAYPELLNEKNMGISFETEKGDVTDLFDPEQALSDKQTIVHIYPQPEGAEWITTAVYYIIAAIVAAGVAMLLAPKLEANQETTSGANWTNPENVVGQGGSMPVILGKRRTGSRVASYGVDSKLYRSRVW